MLRSNTKKAKENIRNYIINHFDNDGYDLPTVTDFNSIAKQIVKTFYDEVGNHKRYNESWQESFIDWCSGLPSILDTCYFYNRSAVDDLGAILEETEEEKSKYTEADAEQMLTKLIFRELYNAVGCCNLAYLEI